MAGEISWDPTTFAVVQVTNQSTLLLAANPDARVRIVIPLRRKLLWLGMDTDAVVSGGMPMTLDTPWREVAVAKSAPIFRGSISAINAGGAAYTIPVLVLEGIATTPAP